MASAWKFSVRQRKSWSEVELQLKDRILKNVLVCFAQPKLCQTQRGVGKSIRVRIEFSLTLVCRHQESLLCVKFTS